MSLDWRGLIGTSAVHTALLFGPWSAIYGTPICLCKLPGDPGIIDVYISRPDTFAAFAIPFREDDAPGDIAVPKPECGKANGFDRQPILLDRVRVSTLRPSSAASRTPTFCVSVSEQGLVKRVRLLSKSGADTQTVAQLRSAVWTLRFEPAVANGRVRAAEIEIGLVEDKLTAA